MKKMALFTNAYRRCIHDSASFCRGSVLDIVTAGAGRARFLVMLLLLAVTAVSAGDLPRIAVYVTGDVSDNEKKTLGTKMLSSLINSGRYMGIERYGAFLAEIDKEHVTQRSGAIDDSQIRELGKRFGVRFVCIADITPAYEAYSVSARIIDVETAAVAFIGESTSRLKTIRDLTAVADRVVRKMFGDDASRGKWASIGFGGIYAGDFGGGIEWGPSGQVAMPYHGVGAYIFFDAVYAEVSAAMFYGGGKWESGNADDPAGQLPDVSRTAVKLGVFGKYPFAVVPSQKIKAFPVLGIDYEAVISGKSTYVSGGGSTLDGGDLSAVWFKGGAGVDVDIAGSAYLRAELLYGARTANAVERDGVDMSSAVGAKARLGHGLTFRCAAAFRF